MEKLTAVNGPGKETNSSPDNYIIMLISFFLKHKNNYVYVSFNRSAAGNTTKNDVEIRCNL